MEDSSAVFLLDTLLSDATKRQCTDIHLLCSGEEVRALFRLHGQLTPYLQSHSNGQGLLRRIKALANMDLACTRTPQEGTFRWMSGSEAAQVRVSLVPISTGQSIVLRLLTKQRFRHGLTGLGMSTEQASRVESLSSGSGLLLVAGPTGSGKTTTLYTLLQQLALSGRCIVTIENPVEVPQSELVQIEVRPTLGVTFASSLRALLRQDPDVIMIGEIRDAETAQAALHAALTGHLVVSTTHANNLVDAFLRISEFGLSRRLLADVFRAVIVQRQNHMYQGKFGPAQRLSREVPSSIAFEVYEMSNQLRDELSSQALEVSRFGLRDAAFVSLSENTKAWSMGG